MRSKEGDLEAELVGELVGREVVLAGADEVIHQHGDTAELVGTDLFRARGVDGSGEDGFTGDGAADTRVVESTVELVVRDGTVVDE